jgi:hypothetical protein
MTIDEMLEELQQYYEAAGFSDFYEDELEMKTDEEIQELYDSTFNDDDEFDYDYVSEGEMVVERIDYRALKKALLNEVGPSGIMPAILEVDCADEEKLVKLAERYGIDIDDYIIKY